MAMFSADAWNAALGTCGIYFALPTQAKGNQVFGRVREFLSGRFKELVVVDTIDRILLAVLQTKHGFIRLFGLAHRNRHY